MGVSGAKNILSIVVLVLVIWMNGLFQGISCQTDRMAQMQKVKNKILLNYDKYIRPTNGTNTTDVGTAYIPRQVMDADEENSILSMDAYLYMHWVDPRLQWDAADYDGYLQLPSSMIWVPDISIYNSHSFLVDPTQEVLLALANTGNVWWVPPIHTQTSCDDLMQATSSYPGDEVTCMIRFGSWMHDGWEVDFQHHEHLHLHELVNIHPRWEVIEEKFSVERNVTIYECCPEPYLSIDVSVVLRRRPIPAIEATRAPCILIMILSLSVFWLPPDSSKKLLMAGFLFLALNVLLVYVGMSNKGPLTVLYAVSFLRTAMYLIVITLLVQVFIVIKIASLTGPSRPPPMIMQFLTGPLGKYACLRSPTSEDKLSLDRMQLKEDSTTVECISARDEWKLLASGIDRALFVVMVVVMVAVHHM